MAKIKPVKPGKADDKSTEPGAGDEQGKSSEAEVEGRKTRGLVPNTNENVRQTRGFTANRNDSMSRR